VAMVVAAIAIPLQIVVGDIVARFDAEHEPAKFATMEVLEHTQRHAPISIGGFPTRDGGIIDPIELPGLLSVLVAFDPNAEVTGLDRIPKDDRPPVAVTHLSFDAMVGSGTALLLIAIVWAAAALRKRPENRAIMALVALGAPLGLIALEAGWFVTEFGRQPWIARGLLRTADAVTTSPALDARFFGFSLIYVALAATCWWLLRRVGRPVTAP
jgi:cytochrome d ubiquinol oxidase subunit I